MSVSKLSNIKAILFDMDNTLINTRVGDNQTCEKLSYYLNENFNLDFEAAEKVTSKYLQLFRENPQSSDVSIYEWRLSLWKKALGPMYDHIADEVSKEYRRLRYHYVKLPSEVRSLLDELQSSYRLCLISNGTSDGQWEKIQECGLESCFECIVISGETPWKKPDANIFYKACDELNVKPEQCVIIGDRIETDIEGGKNASLAATIWIHHTNDSYQLLPGENNCPDFVINKVTELKEILCQLNSPAPQDTTR
ncbi:N-acylneuraminate-9-phosphatase [Planococcus citri]|uniref:N-acylneuraminate-9-phosphatase n=1 Tax=Planococcus citri TaxID=170843 RepID=UPI0031F8D9BB